MSERKGKNVIHIENLKKYYVMGDIEVRALNDISLDVDYGEFTAIMGPSGSGKSTLMNMLGCLDRPTSGLYLLDGDDVSKMDDSQLADIRNQKIGFVFQSFNLLPRTSALDNVIMPLLYSKNKAHAKERAAEALELVGLGSRMNHKPKELSGGQQQRVAVARALVNDPEIIFADEPTGNLDSKSGREIMELLIHLNQDKGKTIIMVTHDQRLGRSVPRVIYVFDGMIVNDLDEAMTHGVNHSNGETHENSPETNPECQNPESDSEACTISDEESNLTAADVLAKAFGTNGVADGQNESKAENDNHSNSGSQQNSLQADPNSQDITSDFDSEMSSDDENKLTAADALEKAFGTNGHGKTTDAEKQDGKGID